MSEMQIRVARAIYEGRNGCGAKPWGSLPRSHQGPYLADARAAIEAMREPTETIINAGRIHVGDDDGLGCSADNARDCFNAMIDAILQEK